jgi:hypothetical protein
LDEDGPVYHDRGASVLFEAERVEVERERPGRAVSEKQQPVNVCHVHLAFPGGPADIGEGDRYVIDSGNNLQVAVETITVIIIVMYIVDAEHDPYRLSQARKDGE